MEIALLISQVILMLLCIWLGARAGGIALGFWGGVGVFVMAFVYGATPAEPPIDVMLIILSVICATAVMQTAGGIDFMVSIAQRIIRKYPNRIVFVGPLVAYLFTFCAGTGHILYPLLPVIHETSLKNGIRPERAMSVSVIASMHGITASPSPRRWRPSSSSSTRWASACRPSWRSPSRPPWPASWRPAW